MHSYSKIFFILIISLLVTSCSAATPTLTREQHEAAIYSLLLDRNPEKYISGTPIVVFGETERLDVDREILERIFPTLEEETFEDYQESNKVPHTIDYPLRTNKPYVLVSKSELDSLIDKYDNWDKFNQKFPETHVVTFFQKLASTRKVLKLWFTWDMVVEANAASAISTSSVSMAQNGK